MRPGKVVKLGPGHYLVVHHRKTGRKPGKRKPVQPGQQDKGRAYCRECSRLLNRNNRSGVCRDCA